MKNLIQSTTAFAMSIACQYIRDDSLVIDATCGNGHDTLQLAEYLRGESLHGQIVAIDIQPAAIDSTKALLESKGFTPQLASGDIALHRGSHEDLAGAVKDVLGESRKACLIVYNLGYLPGGDKSVTTETASTIEAVGSALSILDADGLVCITMYSGHAEGAKEKQALLHFAEELDSREYHVSYISMINQPNDPPEILLISRKG